MCIRDSYNVAERTQLSLKCGSARFSLDDGAKTEPANRWNLCRLLRSKGADRKHQSAQTKSKHSRFLIVDCCVVLYDSFHRITLSARASTFGGIVSLI